MELVIIILFSLILLVCVSIFHQCLRKVTLQETYISRKVQKESILVLGDSHAKVFNHINKKHLLPNVELSVVSVGGATAQGACNPNSKTNALSIFKKNLASKKKHDKIMIMLGEVDCGFVIWYRKEKYNTSVEEQLNNSVTKLFEFIQNEVRSKYAPEQITVIGANLPTLFDRHRNVHNEVANKRQDVKTGIRERTDLTFKYNTILEKESMKRGYKYIDIVKETLNLNTMLVDEQYLHEDENDHHLSETKTIAFWTKKL